MASIFTDAIISQGELYAGASPAASLNYGGMNGYLPRMGLVQNSGESWGEWIANAAYVRKNIIPIVLQSPRFFEFLPNPDQWISLYKSVMEILPFSIDGLQSGLTVETDEHAVGGAGEMQEEPTKVTRARSTINITYRERLGRPINKFFNFLIRYGIMDPDTQKPLISQYFSTIDDVYGLYTPDFYSGTILYIEPDITMKQCNNAWLCSNVFPKGDGEVLGKRDIHSAGELVEYSIEFTAITLNTFNVQLLAQTILENLTILNLIPDTDLVLPATEISPEVEANYTGFNSGNTLGY